MEKISIFSSITSLQSSPFSAKISLTVAKERIVKDNLLSSLEVESTHSSTQTHFVQVAGTRSGPWLPHLWIYSCVCVYVLSRSVVWFYCNVSRERTFRLFFPSWLIFFRRYRGHARSFNSQSVEHTQLAESARLSRTFGRKRNRFPI